jgi:hypothetical protein
MQRQFLHSPISDFTQYDFIRAPAIDFMRRPELLQKLSRRPELPDNFPVKLYLEAEEVLIRAGRDANSPGRTHKHCSSAAASP